MFIACILKTAIHNAEFIFSNAVPKCRITVQAQQYYLKQYWNTTVSPIFFFTTFLLKFYLPLLLLLYNMLEQYVNHK